MARLSPARPLLRTTRSPRGAARVSLLAIPAILLLGSTLGGGAQGGSPESSSRLDGSRRAEIESRIAAAVESFRAAQVARDVDAIRAHLWPEFHMLQDGARTTYSEVSAQIEQTMASVTRLETEWADLRVEALGEELALASFLFSDAITLASGEIVRLRGETSLLWERRGDDWRIRYADSDHYPVASE